MANPERRDPLAILKEGFLEKTKCNKLSQLISGGKKDDFFLKWDTCYWILRETLLLEGYKTNSKSSKDMVKTINLNHCENISVCDFTGKREYVFKLSVYAKGRTKEYLFNAKSEKERDLWVSAIVNVCDLDPDDDTYEWLDVNFTPNDRYLMEKRKKQEGNYSGFQKPSFPPPLPPRLPQGQGFHKSLLSLDESALTSALSKPPLPSRNKMFGSSDNLDLSSSSSFNDRGGYGFLKTMPHLNPPKNFLSSYASTGNVSDSSEEEVDEIYDDSIFEDVTYPGQGGRGQMVSELISNDPNVVKASFSKPSRQNIHPGDRPPLPIPYEESRRSPIPIRMASPPSPPPKVISLAPHSHPMPLPQRNPPRDGGTVPWSVKQDNPSKMPPSPPVKHVSRVNSPPPFGSDGVSSELQQLLSKRQAGLHNTRAGEDVTKSSITPPQPAGRKKAILPPPSKQPPKETSPEQVDNGRNSPTLKKGYINCRDPSFVDGSGETNHSKQRTTSNSTRHSSASSTVSDTPRYPFDMESTNSPSPIPAFPVSCDDTTHLSSSIPHYLFSNQLTSQDTNLSNSQPSNFRSKLSTLDGKSLFEQRAPATSKAEPIYVNWPIPDDLKAELETEDSFAPPVPSRGNRVGSRTPSSGDEASTPVKTKRTSNKPNEHQQGESRNSPQISRQARTPESPPKRNGRQFQLKPIQEDTSQPNVRKKPPLPSKTSVADKPNPTPKPVHFGPSDKLGPSLSPVIPVKPKVAPSRNELNYNSSQQPTPHKTPPKPSYQHSSHASKSSVADKVARFNSELM